MALLPRPCRWADSLSGLLAAGGVRCRAVKHDEFLELMSEKLIWASIFWLLSTALGGLPVKTSQLRLPAGLAA